MKLEKLRQEVCDANLQLKKSGLVLFTWGNVSGYDKNEKLVVIKPSGISYDELSPDLLTIVNLDGEIVEGKFNPSTDTPTHLELYKSFPGIGGIAHTHSTHATIWSQACREIPCYGTTHADFFYGPVPVTRLLTAEEVHDSYEKNTGKVISELFKEKNPLEMPAVLVANHGPFTWGTNAAKAVENSIVFGNIIRATATVRINSKFSICGTCSSGVPLIGIKRLSGKLFSDTGSALS